MVWTWDGTTLTGTANNSPTSISGNLEQMGGIIRTLNGYGVANRVYNKWVFSFSWTQAPDDVGDKLEAMLEYDGVISFTDTTMGNFTFELTDDSLFVNRTAFGVCDAQATFRQK